MRIRLLAILGILCTVLLVLVHPAQAADRSWDWQRWDVVISAVDTTHNTFHVSETQVIKITQGSFAGGDRGVDLGRVTGIDNITVKDGVMPLRFVNAADANSCGFTGGIYCVFTTSDNQRDIYYNFPFRASAGETHTITIDYDVHGALRSYPDGDQFWWSPLASDRDFYVYASTVTVRMPANTPIRSVAAYGPWTQQQEGNTATFTLTSRLGHTDNAEIQIMYPHNPGMPAPSWQPAFDSQQAMINQLGPVVSLGALALTVLLAVGGPLLIFIRYATHGRDPNSVVVPEYLTEPPSDAPPGIAGTLVDERADMADIMATLVDLARRGHLVIEQQQHHGLFDRSPDFIFHDTESSSRATDPNGLFRYELILQSGVFNGATERKLSDLRNKFYRVIPQIKSQLYEEVVKAGYFARSPESVRNRWGCLSGVLIFGPVILVIVAANAKWALPVVRTFPLLVLPLLGLVVTGFAAMAAAKYMPAKTRLGSQEAAKWKAFRNYLAHIDKYTDVNQAQDQFEKYIGYAVAFGLDKHWIHSFSKALTSMPNWYYPTYLGGPWHSGYHSSRMMDARSFSGGSGSMNLTGGLNSVSGDLTQGLNAMSSGLTSLLNSASKTMSSSPGGGGGGGHGGGSSGGGHAGGH
jgi:Predicted membrane protein (DUF2207)